MSSSEDGPWSNVVPAFVDGRGEALLAARDLAAGARLLRVAPLAAVPYADALDARCGGCFRPCDASRRCDGCGVARTCERCARGFAREAHARECHALRRLAQNDAGLSLAHTDLRLLLRLLARRFAAPRLDADADDANLDPAAEAAARDGDVIVDDYDAVLELMSGLQGGDDGLLSDDAVATLHEVAKQCKYLVDPQLRASTDEYVALLGRLQLNGFELTAAEASAETAGKHAPIGVGVFPSAARFNHSCEANAEQRFDKHGCIVVETRRAVPRGEELTIPYVDERLGWRERNERLRKNFAFTCECAKCKREREAEGERKRGR